MRVTVQDKDTPLATTRRRPLWSGTGCSGVLMKKCQQVFRQASPSLSCAIVATLHEALPANSWKCWHVFCSCLLPPGSHSASPHQISKAHTPLLRDYSAICLQADKEAGSAVKQCRDGCSGSTNLSRHSPLSTMLDLLVIVEGCASFLPSSLAVAVTLVFMPVAIDSVATLVCAAAVTPLRVAAPGLKSSRHPHIQRLPTALHVHLLNF